MPFTRTQRYQIVNNTIKTLAYRNRRDEPQIHGAPRMLAEELDLFELLCAGLDERLTRAAGGELVPLAEALIAFRTAVPVK
jgi:hypothetical protein